MPSTGCCTAVDGTTRGQAYPVALAFLRAAELAGRTGEDLRTHGGRLVRVGTGGVGRYARNAVVQGAAAELFKAWAATVRNGLGDGRVVLCLHELLLHVPVEQAARRSSCCTRGCRPLPATGLRAAACASSPTSALSGGGPEPRASAAG